MLPWTSASCSSSAAWCGTTSPSRCRARRSSGSAAPSAARRAAGSRRGSGCSSSPRPDTRAAIAELLHEDEWVAQGREPWMSVAPAHIVVCTREQDYHDRYNEPDKLAVTGGVEIEWPAPFWFVDAGAAMMLLLLAAIDEGPRGRRLRRHRSGDAGVQGAARHPRRRRGRRRRDGRQGQGPTRTRAARRAACTQRRRALEEVVALGTLVERLAARADRRHVQPVPRRAARAASRRATSSQRADAPLLLVGEAAGYRGARVSGIPFTSERQLTGSAAGRGDRDDRPPRARGARARATPCSSGTSCRRIPGPPTSNRPPTRAEVEAGLPFARELARGRRVVAVGRIAEAALGRAVRPASVAWRCRGLP